MTTPKTNSPSKRAGGRPRKAPEDRTVVTTMRLTPARKEKLRALGSAWLSQMLDGATAPARRVR
jgi:hypothetical protein